jgi:peroxiredoxin
MRPKHPGHGRQKWAAFTLPDQDGKKHKPADYQGKNISHFFYQKGDAPPFVSTHDFEPCPMTPWSNERVC